VPPEGDFVQPNAGPVGIGTFTYRLSDQSVAVREAANQTIRRICERQGVGKFLELTETDGVYAAHPLGGCRMADSADLGVVNDRCEVFGYDGLFCMDSSVIPTSLGVNPSLTISAVCERAAERLVGRGHDLGLPRPPNGLRLRTPPEHVGPHRRP
jgi:choline dehydrogenase-like flavoprotein